MRKVRFVNLPRDRVGLMRMPRGREFEVEGAGFFDEAYQRCFLRISITSETTAYATLRACSYSSSPG